MNRKRASKTLGRRSQTGLLEPGDRLGTHYEVMGALGAGSEGEVYRVEEMNTGIHRAAKLFYPKHKRQDRSMVWYAKKLYALRHCDIVMQYHHIQSVWVEGVERLCLISELSDGVQLERWINSHRGNRVHPYVALQILYELVRGLEAVHAEDHYHADVHSQNILVTRVGISFELKLVDFYNWGRVTRYKQQQDIVDSLRLFVECLGGIERYQTFSPEMKAIACGGRADYMLRRFPTMSSLRLHLKSFEWAE